MSNVLNVLFDFLNAKLTPKIQCSSPAMDGYEVENLISAVDLVKSRGFIGYSSIKPPVDLDFQLVCPVSLGYVFVSTTVGAQKSNGIELFAKNGNSCEFVSIAKALFDKEDGVYFCNSRLFSVSSPPPSYNKRYHLCFLKRDRFRIFINANHVRVRIIRTDKSVPCIGRVEIWGRVSKLCSVTTANTVRSLMQPRTHTKNTERVTSTNKATVVGTSQDTDADVPEDFKDALTFEIMTTPMMLPCGSNVDSTTLDKFIENEATHGRQPSDPFTGLKFNDNRKPVMNAALKSRIDMYLLEHADIAKSAASRTIAKTVSLPTRIDLDVLKDINSKRKTIVNPSPEPSNSNSTKKSKSDDESSVSIEQTVSTKGFMGFTPKEVIQSKNNKLVCSECEAAECLYLLPCKHLYCRKCLMDVCSELKCKHCHARFTRADPKKFHSV